MNLDKIYDTALEAARRAGELIAERRRSGSWTLSYKSGSDPVTSADIDAEKLIIETICAAFPEHGILCEESAPLIGDSSRLYQPLWIIDPIDGTTNYANNHLHCAVSIAFSMNAAVQVGVVHAPFEGETFTAIKDRGAMLNGQSIRTGERRDLKYALIASGFRGWTPTFERDLKRMAATMKLCRDLRRYGAASLDIAWVACGRLDAYYETIKPWDFAAACLIAREAGCFVGHIGPIPPDSQVPAEFFGEDIFVAAPGVADQLLSTLRAVDAQHARD